MPFSIDIQYSDEKKITTLVITILNDALLKNPNVNDLLDI